MLRAPFIWCGAALFPALRAQPWSPSPAAETAASPLAASATSLDGPAAVAWDREQLPQSSLATGAEAQNAADASCDVTSSGPLCFASQQWALLPSAKVPGLVGWWTFNEQTPLDSSGNGNHGTSAILHGPSPAGGGHSAIFSRNFLLVPHSKQFQLEDFTYSFWVNIRHDAGSRDDRAARWCPLLRKGVYLSKAEEFANAPALLYSRKTGRLRAAVTTTESSRGDGEFVDSSARLLPNRWTHVALVHHRAKARLLIYVNGILDAATATKGRLVLNEYPLYVGGDPFTAEACGQTLLLDELRVHDRALAPHELQAQAAPAFGGADPSYVHLGCSSCTLREAIRSCPKTRHICTSLELHTGGYQVARSLGWLAAGTRVWTHAAIADEAALERQGQSSAVSLPENGLGLCCNGAA